MSAIGPDGSDAAATFDLPLPKALEAIRRRFAEADAALEEVRRLGAHLFDLLAEVGEQIVATRDRLGIGEQLWVELSIPADTREVAALPWEALCDPDGHWLAANNLAIVRYLPRRAPRTQIARSARLSVFLTAAPPHDDPVRQDIEQEYRAIRSVLTQSAAPLTVRSDAALTFEALRRAVRRGPHVWHFVGHGATEGVGALVLVDQNGDATPAAVDALVALVRGTNLRLIVLDSCGGAQARDTLLHALAPAFVAAGVPAVVAIQGTITTEASRTFATAFYNELSDRSSIADCVIAGRLALLKATGDSQWVLPVVYTRTRDSDLFSAEREAGWWIRRAGAALAFVLVALVIAIQPGWYGWKDAGLTADDEIVALLQTGGQTLASIKRSEKCDQQQAALWWQPSSGAPWQQRHFDAPVQNAAQCVQADIVAFAQDGGAGRFYAASNRLGLWHDDLAAPRLGLRRLGAGVLPDALLHVAVAPGVPATVVVISNEPTVYLSDNGGQSWHTPPATVRCPTGFAALPPRINARWALHNGTSIYVATNSTRANIRSDDGIYASDDGGTCWRRVHDAASTYAYKAIAAMPGLPDGILALAQDTSATRGGKQTLLLRIRRGPPGNEPPATTLASWDWSATSLYVTATPEREWYVTDVLGGVSCGDLERAGPPRQIEAPSFTLFCLGCKPLLVGDADQRPMLALWNRIYAYDKRCTSP